MEFKSFEEAINSFNFEGVAQAMNILGWNYGFGEPVTASTIKSVVYNLYKRLIDGDLIKNQDNTIESGRMSVTIKYYDDAPYLYMIKFKIEESALVNTSID